MIKLTPIALIFVCMSCNINNAQDSLPVKLHYGKTEKQIIEEYSHWMKIKNDWANLAYYKEANASLHVPTENEGRVVFMGNSITEMWKVHSPEFFKNKAFINRGISGQTTPQMLLRFRQDVIQLQPNVVVILAGTNDIAGNTGPTTNNMILDNIISMIELAKANKIKVVLCSVLPVNKYPWFPNLQPAERVISLNKSLEAYATENNIIYINYYTALVDDKKGLPKTYAEDGVHPNKIGYSIMEPLVMDAINKTSKK